MNNVLIDLIIRMEEYLLTQSAKTKVSDLIKLDTASLWKLHDKLLNDLRNIL